MKGDTVVLVHADVRTTGVGPRQAELRFGEAEFAFSTCCPGLAP
jgi:hypothetical protein